MSMIWWKQLFDRAEKIKKIEDEYYEKDFVEYRDKKTGEKIDAIPRCGSPLTSNRGYCVHCNKLIDEPVSDDRFCKACYIKLFPEVWKRSVAMNVTREKNENVDD